MAILLRQNKVAVEKVKQHGAAEKSSFIVVPESEEYVGIIRYVGETADPKLQVGQKVYFSTNYQKCRMGSVDLCVMQDIEIFAIVTD